MGESEPQDDASRTETISGDDVPLVPRARLERGASVGRYVLLDELGRGGMGVVYAAFDPELDRKVAIKLLRARDDDAGVGSARLLREAKAMAQLGHPNAVTVHDVGTFGAHVFIAMEFVEGVTLRAWARAQRRPWHEVLAIMIAAGRGLAAAHAAGLVHGDFKPDNVMLTPQGAGPQRVRVMDFGLARREGEDDASTKAIVGTPGYVAPELLAGRAIDARADQFAFGATLWELLYSAPAFAGTTALEISASVVRGELASPSRSVEVPAWVRACTLRALSPAPQDRFASIDALLDALAQDPRRKRRRVTMLLAAGTAAIAVLGGRQLLRARNDAACVAEGERIGDTWNAARRDAMSVAIAGSGAGNATTVAAKLVPLLDDYADAWQGARTRVCRAASVEGTLADEPRRRSEECLDERAVDFAALVDVLAVADAAQVQQAVESALGLERIAPCEDERALREAIALPPDEATRTQVRALQERLAHSSALLRAGAYADAVAAARPIVDEAAALDWSPLLARAQLRLGRALDSLGDYPAAESSLRTAYFLAGEVGADVIAEEAAIQLVQTVGNHRVRFGEAEIWAEHARMLHARRGDPDDDIRTSRLEQVLANVSNARGDLDVALVHYRRSLAIREAVFGPDHLDVANALVGLGRTLNQRGAYDEAASYDERALAIRERALGPDHPVVAGSLINLSSTELARGRYDDALAHARRALEIRERALGSDSIDTATALGNLGIVYKSHGDLARAIECQRRALAIRELRLGPEHPDVAAAMQNLALALAAKGEHAEAEQLLTDAVARLERALGPDHRDVARTLMNLGNVQAATGRLEQAKAAFARSLVTMERVDGPEHPDVAKALGNLGDVELRRGDAAAALPLLQRSLAIRERTLGANHPHVAYALLDVARAQLALGDDTAAIAPLERALEIHRINDAAPRAVAPTRFALARALRGSDLTRACTLAAAARDGYGDARPAELDAFLDACPR